jgi:hypothetical protein
MFPLVFILNTVLTPASRTPPNLPLRRTLHRPVFTSPIQNKKPLTEGERGCTNQIPLTIKPYPSPQATQRFRKYLLTLRNF